MTTLRIVLAAATALAFLPLAGAEELTPSDFLRGDTPDQRVFVIMNAGTVYNDVILLDYADGWARIFAMGSREGDGELSAGPSEEWIQVSNISAIRFPSSLGEVPLEEKRAAALELKKKLKEGAAARYDAMTAAAANRGAVHDATGDQAAERLIERIEKAIREQPTEEQRMHALMTRHLQKNGAKPEPPLPQKPEAAPAPTPEEIPAPKEGPGDAGSREADPNALKVEAAEKKAEEAPNE